MMKFNLHITIYIIFQQDSIIAELNTWWNMNDQYNRLLGLQGLAPTCTIFWKDLYSHALWITEAALSQYSMFIAH